MKILRVSLLACALLAGACQSEKPKSTYVPQPPAGILTASEVDQAPRLASRAAPPQYPFELRRAGISGQADVRFIVTHDGRVIDVVVTKATDPAFGLAATEAVSKWKYQPAIKDGQPIACLLEVPLVFSLHEKK